MQANTVMTGVPAELRNVMAKPNDILISTNATKTVLPNEMNEAGFVTRRSSAGAT